MYFFPGVRLLVDMLKIQCGLEKRNAVSGVVETTDSSIEPTPPVTLQSTGWPGGGCDVRALHVPPPNASGIVGGVARATSTTADGPIGPVPSHTVNLTGTVLPFLNTLEPSGLTGCSTARPG